MVYSRREAWLMASVEITSAVLAGTGPGGLWSLIAKSARIASKADLALVYLPAGEPGWLKIVAAVGETAGAQLGESIPEVRSIVGLSVIKGEPLLWDDMANHKRLYPPARARLAQFGPGMCVPIVDPQGARLGVLGVTKSRGRLPFDDQDVAMLGSFASQAVLARRLNDHRAQAEELRVLEERDRIAREMHDHILQELFATGLTLQSIASAEGAEPPERQRRRLLGTVGRLDAVIGQIRATIFGLQPPIPDQRPVGLVRHRILDVAQDVMGQLGFTPSLHFRGPVELVTTSVAGDLVAVVREALSNAARHSRATAVTVEVVADASQVAVRITDNGQGMGDTTRRSGLRNLRIRAERHGGTFSVASRDAGTTLTWTVPVPSADSASLAQDGRSTPVSRGDPPGS